MKTKVTLTCENESLAFDIPMDIVTLKHLAYRVAENSDRLSMDIKMATKNLEKAQSLLSTQNQMAYATGTASATQRFCLDIERAQGETTLCLITALKEVLTNLETKTKNSLK